MDNTFIQNIFEDENLVDGNVVDENLVDGNVVDVNVVDENLVDGKLVDGKLVDVNVVDVNVVDGNVVDENINKLTEYMLKDLEILDIMLNLYKNIEKEQSKTFKNDFLTNFNNLNPRTKNFLRKKGLEFFSTEYSKIIKEYINNYNFYIIDFLKNLGAKKFLLKYLYIHIISESGLNLRFLREIFAENINSYINYYGENYLNFINNNLINCKLFLNNFYFMQYKESFIVYYFKKNTQKLEILLSFIKKINLSNLYSILYYREEYNLKDCAYLVSYLRDNNILIGKVGSFFNSNKTLAEKFIICDTNEKIIKIDDGIFLDNSEYNKIYFSRYLELMDFITNKENIELDELSIKNNIVYNFPHLIFLAKKNYLNKNHRVLSLTSESIIFYFEKYEDNVIQVINNPIIFDFFANKKEKFYSNKLKNWRKKGLINYDLIESNRKKIL